MWCGVPRGSIIRLAFGWMDGWMDGWTGVMACVVKVWAWEERRGRAFFFVGVAFLAGVAAFLTTDAGFCAKKKKVLIGWMDGFIS